MVKKNDKRGLGVAQIVLLFIGIIVCTTLIVSIAQNKGQLTDLSTVANASLGTMTNGSTLYITDYRSCSSFKIWNATNDVEIPSTNYTVTNNVIYNGAMAISVVPAVETGAGVAFNRGTAKYDGVCEPLTYDENSASRTIADLIIILCAIALVVFVLENAGITDLFGRN